MDQPCVFGKYDHLLGVENIAEQAAPFAVIMMTPGMLHSVGPYRMHVDIARSLEEQQISSLRFDLSGIGESLGVGVSGRSIDRAASEATEAMDYLSDKHGIKQFVLFGLCSGADDSVQAALQDNRVKGVITIDGAGYKTPKFWLKELFMLGRKSLMPEKILNHLKLKLGKNNAPASLALGDDVREFPESPELAEQEFQALIDKSVQLHFIYTGGTKYYNYAQQFYDMLPGVNWKGTESTRYFSQMDHLAMLCEDRVLLVEHITDKAVGMLNQLKLSSAA